MRYVTATALYHLNKLLTACQSKLDIEAMNCWLVDYWSRVGGAKSCILPIRFARSLEFYVRVCEILSCLGFGEWVRTGEHASGETRSPRRAQSPVPGRRGWSSSGSHGCLLLKAGA